LIVVNCGKTGGASAGLHIQTKRPALIGIDWDLFDEESAAVDSTISLGWFESGLMASLLLCGRTIVAITKRAMQAGQWRVNKSVTTRQDFAELLLTS